MGFRPRVKRTRDGRFKVQLPEGERAVLRALPDQLRTLLSERDVLVHRLFPPAYTDDVERAEEYRRLMEDDLLSGHLAKVDIFEQTLDATDLTEDEVVAWLGALNDLRLVLGTRLDVTEDMGAPAEDDPDAGLFAVYAYLGWLQEQVVAALSSTLPR